MLHNCFEKRRHVFVIFVQLAHGKAGLCAGVDDWEIKLIIGRLQLNKQIEDAVEDLVWTRIFPVDFVNNDEWLEFVFQRLAQNKARLSLRSVMGIDDYQ